MLLDEDYEIRAGPGQVVLSLLVLRVNPERLFEMPDRFLEAALGGWKGAGGALCAPRGDWG